MLDPNEQLSRLRQRIAAIDRRFAVKTAALPRPQPAPARWFIEQWAEGEVVRNRAGEHFQMERVFARHKRHGSAEIGALADLPHDFLDALGENQIPAAPPERWAFLDTETTGLLGSPGVYAFLIGVGRITPDGFKVRQFFMREYAEERSVLDALASHLKEFDILITYNGKTYDQPLLEMRYGAMHANAPFERLPHLDLLNGARRLWKLRIDDCRLMQLERQILGVEREGDLPGDMIPYVYFEYVRSHEAQRLVPIFHHNAMDILTLACLAAIVPAAFRKTDADSLARAGVRRGEDLAGIARWLAAAGEREAALDVLKRAVETGLPDRLLFRALWDIALFEKKLGRPEAALPRFAELADCRNQYRVSALIELAKHSEREARNFEAALDYTNRALLLDFSPELERRRERLERRLAKRRSSR